jgi:hypothetical protein
MCSVSGDTSDRGQVMRESLRRYTAAPARHLGDAVEA